MNSPPGDAVQTFRGTTVAEALAEVRRTIGPDAVIVAVRPPRPRWGFASRAAGVELIAGRGHAPSRLPADPDGPVDRFLGPTPQVDPSEQADPTAARGRSSAFADLLAAPPVTSVPVAAEPGPESSVPDAVPPGRPPLRLVVPEAEAGPAAETPDLDGELTPDRGVDAPFPPGPAGRTLPRSESAARLIERGLNVRVAATLLDARPRDAAEIDAVRSVVADPGLPGETAELIARLAGQVACRDAIADRRAGRPIWTAFLGGTGVGKTTTIAKLAAWQALGKRLKVGLITVDTYRVGAVDQLAAYAEVLRLPLTVVATVEQLTAARRQYADCDWVLVDTAGRSPRDEEPIAQVTRLLSAMPLDEVLWVHPVSQGVDPYRHLRAQWPRIRPTGLVLTKLDECPRFGALWDVLRAGDPPLIYLTDGQNVPQDILAASPAAVAAGLMLGPGAVSGGRPRGRHAGGPS